MVGQWQDLGSVNIWDGSIISQLQPCPLEDSPGQVLGQAWPWLQPLETGALSPPCQPSGGSMGLLQGWTWRGGQLAVAALCSGNCPRGWWYPRLSPPTGLQSCLGSQVSTRLGC